MSTRRRMFNLPADNSKKLYRFICRGRSEKLTGISVKKKLLCFLREGAPYPVTGFGREGIGRGRFFRWELVGACAQCISDNAEVLQIPDAPDADQKMQLHRCTLAQRQTALHRLRHDQRHVFAVRQPAEQKVSHRVRHSFV